MTSPGCRSTTTWPAGSVASSPSSPSPNWLASGSQTNPIGTGPFVFQAWVPNDHFTATKNPHYWRPGYPYLDSITYKPIPDSRASC